MSSIKKNRFWILIVHVLDMPDEKTCFIIEWYFSKFPPQYILFGNDAEQSAVVSD